MLHRNPAVFYLMNEGRTVFAQLLGFLPKYEFDQRHKAAINLHTLLTLHGNFPMATIITSGSVHDVSILDQLVWEAGAFYIMDRGYLDFARWHRLHQCGAFFVTRAKQIFRCTRRHSRPVDRAAGPRFDQTVVTTGMGTRLDYPDPLRRIGYRDSLTGKSLVFLTNNITVPALTIAHLYWGTLANRTLVQMAQATSAHQSILRHVAHRDAHPILDTHRRFICSSPF